MNDCSSIILITIEQLFKYSFKESVMKKVFKLEGLDCANCAAKMEKDISGLDGVNKASISLMTQRLVMDIDENISGGIADTVKKIVNKYEPDVVVK